MQSKFFAAVAQKTIFAFMSYLPELSDFKLYDGTWHSEQLNPFRKQRLKIAEVSLPFFNEERLNEGITSTIDLRKLQLLYTLFPHILIYANSYAQTDVLVSLQPAYLHEFFRLWLFEDVGEYAQNSADETQPRLMALKVSDFFKNAPHKRPELMHSIDVIEASSESKEIFTKSFYPESSEFLEMFGDKHAVVSRFTENQRAHFKFLKP